MPAILHNGHFQLSTLVEKQMRNWELAQAQQVGDARPQTRGVHDFVAISRRPGSGGAEVRDAALIAGIQQVEHDQIAGYGCARAWAQVLGDNDARTVLQKCLTEEKNCDAELSRIAEKTNQRAAAALAVV